MIQKYFLVISFVLASFSINGQRLVEIINQAEKAVFIVQSLSHESEVSESRGFFISSDGIAMIPLAMLSSGDSLVVQLSNNRKFGVERILEVSTINGMAIVKIDNSRQKDFSYLIPARQLFRDNQETILFAHPAEYDAGLAYAIVAKVNYQFLLGRYGELDKIIGKKSAGSPLIDIKGQLIGVANANPVVNSSTFLSSAIINDSTWQNLNISFSKLNSNSSFNNLNNVNFHNGLCYMGANQFELAARSFSNYIKINTNSEMGYACRGYARYKYSNTYGSREDISISHRINSNGYGVYYIRALICIEDNKDDEAFNNLMICLQKKPDFAMALVQRGKLQFSLKKNLESSLADFSKATLCDSTYGESYYEKARFILQYFEDKELAFTDINRAVELSPGLPGVYTIRGTMYLKTLDYLLAIQDFDKAILKDPKDTYAYFNRGLANFNLGIKKQACDDWQKAGSMGHYKAVQYLSKYCNSTSREY